MKRPLCFLLSVLILNSCAIQALAFYHPDEGRWISRDPIGERGGINVYAALKNALTQEVDFHGLMSVCCSQTRTGQWFDNIIRHCHMADSCFEETETSYPIWMDDSKERKLDNGKTCNCATKEDIAECLKRHPYSEAPRGKQHWIGDYMGNNCQTSIILSLGNCCLKSNWSPNFYAGNTRGKCLKYEYIMGPPGGASVCVEWETSDWTGTEAPEEPDDRLPPIGQGPDRPPKPR